MTSVPGTTRLARLGLPPRDPAEQHRASTPLELLFDLTIVVAVAQAGAELHHALAGGDAAGGVVRYAMVFFAIWWAWMNFTWFGSAYDTDDVGYRFITLVQLCGALVIAAGIPSAFEQAQFATVTIGYTIMRVGLVTQWLRAAAGDPERRRVTLGYAGGVTLVQVGWLARLLLPAHLDALGVATFLALVAADVAVPFWAERRGETTTRWHPEHIAERYSLFTLIVLGESILAVTVTTQRAVGEAGLSAPAVVLAVAALLVVFSLWWVYFEDDVGEGLRSSPGESFRWGYGHYAVFALVAALGAGLQVAAEHVSGVGSTTGSAGSLTEGGHGLGLLGTGLAVGVPVAGYLLVMAWLHNRLDDARVPAVASVGSAVAALLCAVAAPAVGVPAAVAGMALVTLSVVAVKIRAARPRPAPVALRAGS